jgi:hypothetical protein
MSRRLASVLCLLCSVYLACDFETDTRVEAVNSCTTDICVENDRTDGRTEPPGSPDLVTEATGYAYPASINRLGPNNHLELRIESTVRPYRIQILRLGDYGNIGARIVATLPGGGGSYAANDQPPCFTESDPNTGPYTVVDHCRNVGFTTDSCASWTGPTWTHPPELPSGIYLAHVVDSEDGQTLASVPFTVRDDRRTSAVLVQVPDTTRQAYNLWGDTCNLPGIGAVYVGPPTGLLGQLGIGGRIRTARFDRPYEDQLWYQHVSTYVRFLEHIAADVSYITAHDLDADWARPQDQSLLVHATGANRVVIIAGHDEYWSQERRNNIERARRAGVHLMFLTANEIHWRTLVQGPDAFFIAKETNFEPELGSQPSWTGLWGDPRYVRSTNGDATGPENATSGLVSGAFSREYHYEVLVSAHEARHRFWRGTAYANGGTTAIPTIAGLRVVNGEWDMDVDNGFRPRGLVYLSSTPTVGNYITMGPNEGHARSNYTSQITHHMIMFRDPQSGAITFHAGTTDFSSALEAYAPCNGGDPHLASLQRGLINMMADMGLPAPRRLPCDDWWTPPPPLPAPPSGTVAAPASPPMMGRSLELRGSATASGGATVAAVEVGIRRQGTSAIRYTPAAGRESWFYDWTPPAPGTYEIRARVTDDRGQTTETAFITVPVAATTRLYSDSDTFGAFSTFAVGRWMGTRFRAAVGGTVSQLRISMPDTAAYSVALVDMDASPRTAVFGTTEAKAGWRSFVFATPVTITANRNYAALMWVPAERLYPFVPTSQRSDVADAPPLQSSAGLNSSDADWSQLTAVPFGFPADVVFDASAYWSTASTTRGWFATPPAVTVRTSSVEQRIGYQWTPRSDGYVDGVRMTRPPGDTNDYLVELRATASRNLGDGPAVLAAGAIRNGSSVATFDVPVRVFRGHAYRTVVNVKPGNTYPHASTPPSGSTWLSVTPVAVTCNRNPDYNQCETTPTEMFPEFQPTSERAAIDIAFRPTAGLRQSLWPHTGVTPMQTETAQTGGTMGTLWQSPADGYVEAIRFFDRVSETATVRLYDRSPSCAPGVPLETCARICSATGTPTQDASGWYTLRFERPCPVARDHDYIASVYLPSGNRAFTDDYFQRMDPISMQANFPTARNLYEDGFLVASGGGVATGDAMPVILPSCFIWTGSVPSPCDATRRAYFVEPIVRDGR